jgi:hypothetical protein
MLLTGKAPRTQSLHAFCPLVVFLTCFRHRLGAQGRSEQGREWEGEEETEEHGPWEGNGQGEVQGFHLERVAGPILR